MSPLKAGDAFPEGVSFTYIPYSPVTNDNVLSCGAPAVTYDASKEFSNKKIVLVAVPGAFTPTCQADHVTSFIGQWDKLKSKGVDHVVMIASNDHWVMSAWGKANNVKDDSILFMSDSNLEFSKKFGWCEGDRAGRYAFLINNGKIVYAHKAEITIVDGVDANAILALL